MILVTERRNEHIKNVHNFDLPTEQHTLQRIKVILIQFLTKRVCKTENAYKKKTEDNKLHHL